MAITLPDFTALPQVTPQAGGSLMQYPQTDAAATGEAALGKGLEAAGGAATDVAAYQDIARTRADRAMAEADLLNRTTKLDAQLKTETDPQKITDLSNAYQDALNTSSQAIGNGDARSMWLAQNQHRVALGQANAYLKNTEVYRDNYLAGADQQLTSLTQIATSSDDPAARDDAQSKIGALIGGMRASGTISAAQAQERADKVAQGLILGRADFLSATGRAGEALTYLQQNRQHVPAAALEERTKLYKERDTMQVGQRLADRASAGDGGAAPAAQPAPAATPDGALPPGAEGAPGPVTELTPAAATIAQGMATQAAGGGLAPGGPVAGPGAPNEPPASATAMGQESGGLPASPAPPAAAVAPAAAPPGGTTSPVAVIDTKYQQQLKAINDDRTATQEQKDIATSIVTERYNRLQAASADAIEKANAQITRLTQTAATNDDPAQRDAAAKNIDSLIDGLRTSGYISLAQADTLSDKARGGVVVARADYLDASGNASQARQYLDQYKKLVPPAELDQRMTIFRKREEDQGAAALADKVTAANALPTPPDQLPPGTPDAVSRSQGARAQTINLESSYQQQLQAINTDQNSTPKQKNIAAGIVTDRYERAKAAVSGQTRKEATAVKQLIKDDEASIAATGTPVPGLDTERVRNALGDDAANQFDEQRAGTANYYIQTHDLANLTQPEIDQRIASLKPTPGMPGFARNRYWEVTATKMADDLRKQRITDPSASVSTLPDVQDAAKTASLDRPETFAPLVYTRIHAMDRVGIPAENQVPITNQEALELWKPIGLATEGGNPREIKEALTDTVQRLQTATNGLNANQALEAVLRAGHASQQTAGIAAALVKKISRNEVPTPQDAAALDEAQKTDATNKAAAQMQNDYQVRTVGEPVVPQSVPARTWPAADATALQMLKAEPQRAAQFDATYGPGQAAAALKTMTPPVRTMPPVITAPNGP